ncbi:conserved hypothetical protein [Anaeromyxobacter sp. K]|uniref:hypothetical protein n=1 Tax=Anaeromyxobacter sp. (strain K) TaxID=447217 RepID=UPI00015F8B7A|nr:hypothetical protein [Anaeromyxobacter sp. K]ACG75051.1 conserved hypothetical protein [Anaeromyxobacter sp. K]
MRRLRSPALLAVLVTGALALAACRAPASPADQYRRFASAARAGDAATVWSMLSARSREALDAEAKALAGRAPGVVPASGRELVLGDFAARAARIRSAVVVRESSGTAIVAVEDEAGAKGEVTLVREDGAWRVVLPGVDAGGR